MNLGFLVSHNGSNMQAIVDACKSGALKSRPRVVISNNSGSGGLARARSEGIAAVHLSSATHPDEMALDEAILDALKRHGVELVISAGYMKKLGPQTLKAYENRILNIHPAMLPAYGGPGFYGARVHQAVLDNQETKTGVTVHLVDGEYDHGTILGQTEVTVLLGDTVESLSARVLAAEHRFFVETLTLIETGVINL